MTAPGPSAVSLPEGVLVAVVTPFRDDERIDFTAWQSVLELLAASNVMGVLAISDTGEFDVLREEERVVAMRFCRQMLGPAVKLLGHVGGAATHECVRLARAAEAERLDGVVVTPPPWVALSREEIGEQVAEVARHVRIPTHRGHDLRASVGANVAPRAYVELDLAVRAGRNEDAARLRALVEPLERAFMLPTWPAGVKAAMALAGVPGGVPRRPVAGVTGNAELEAAVAQLRAAHCLG